MSTREFHVHQTVNKGVVVFLYLSSKPVYSWNEGRERVVRLTSANLVAFGFEVSYLGFNLYLITSQVVRFFINGHLAPVGKTRYIVPGDVVTFVPCMTSVLLGRNDGHIETVAQKQTRFALLFDGWPIDAEAPLFSQRVWPKDLFDALHDHDLVARYTVVRWFVPH